MLGIFNRESRWVSPSGEECNNCGTISYIPSKTQVVCNECNSKRVKTEDVQFRMYRRAKSRAKEKSLPFNIVPSDIVIPEVCPVFGYPLIVHTQSGGWNDSPSLDRIIPELGYVKGNIQVISGLANRMKANASPRELEMFANWILNN